MRIEEGQAVSIIGANGAGKTTLLSTIVGLLKPNSGRILFDGEEISGLAPYKIAEFGISFVPEDRKLFGSLSVQENLILGAYSPRARVKKEESLKMVYELFPVLAERKKQLATTLSGESKECWL